MKIVSRFEAHLLSVLQAIVGQVPVEQAWPLLSQPLPRPLGLRPAALDLVQEMLGKGMILGLAQRGWRNERFLRAGRPVQGRLWQRGPVEALPLSFSGQSLELLIQLVSRTLHTTQPSALTLGDRLLLAWTYAAFEAELGKELRKAWPTLERDGLCRLLFLDMPTAHPELEWECWLTEPGVLILEAMQHELADRWIALEKNKTAWTDPALMQRLGQNQELVWTVYLETIDRAHRRDLARPILRSARILFESVTDAKSLVGNLDVKQQRLADRAQIYRAALVLPRMMERLQCWEAEARLVGYFEENYAASQMWKADWQADAGDDTCQRCRAILRSAEGAISPGSLQQADSRQAE